MSEAMPLQPGKTFAEGRFVLVKRLGRGGMGEVWLARDERLREPVALKFLPPEIRGDAGALDDLRRETARSHQLSHPNIVRIHDLFEDPDGTAFIVMEYIDGWTLAAVRLEQPARVLPWEYLRPLVAQLCAALEYAHGEKVIHRDLKPANLMVDSRGRLKLADFGIAAVASDSMSRISVRHSTSGTLPYMSPQQVTGKRPQATDDIYALGATLYELLTSQPPFHSGDITHQVLHQAPEPLADRLGALGIQNDIPPDAAALIMACLAKEPGERPPSARAVAEWIGLELEVKPSAESLAAALFPETPSVPEAVAPEPAGEGRPMPGRFGRNLVALGIVVLVMAAAFWLRNATLLHDHSTAPLAPQVAVQSPEMEPEQIPSTATPATTAAAAPSATTMPAPAPSSTAEVPLPPQGLLTNVAATADWRRGLVVYFSFDEPPQNGVVHDDSGSGNDGWVVNARWTAQGRRGGGFQFSRTNSYITVLNNASLNPPQITLAAWIKTSYSDSIYRRIFDKYRSEGFALSEGGDYISARQIHYRQTGQFVWDIGVGPPDVSHAVDSTGQRIDDGLWHHLAATYDGATQRLYLDGQPVSTNFLWRGGIQANAYDLTIAGNRSSPTRAGEVGASFDGLMDEVMMFNRALSPEEVRQLYDLPSVPETAADSMAAQIGKTGDSAALPTPAAPPIARASAPAADRLKTVTTTIFVPGTSDPWLAGMPNGSTASGWSGWPGHYDTAPVESPVQVTGMPIVSGAILTFSATGSEAQDRGVVASGPGGRVTAIRSHNAGPENGIANIVVPIDALLGVFLDDQAPLNLPPPSSLTFATAAARDFVMLRPALRQPFYIGSGSTSGGVAQKFVVPTGATRLFLGPMDSYVYSNNVGGFTVAVTCLPAVVDSSPRAASTTTEAQPPSQRTVTDPAAAADWRRGLVLYFNFDEPSKNGVVLDQSGQHNDGRVVGARWTNAGKLGGGYVFLRTNSYILVPNNPSLNPPQITLAAWIKISYADARWRRIFDKNFSRGFALSVTGDLTNWAPPSRYRGHITFEINSRSLLLTNHIRSDQDLNDGRWHHVAATYDGSTERMFVDGVEQQSAVSITSDLKPNESNLRLGGFEVVNRGLDDPRTSFDGLMDEVMMFNRALSPDEVRHLYELPSSPEDAAHPDRASANARASQAGQR